MVTRGTVKGDDFRIIYKSPVFPTSSFAYAHDLKPELAKKIIDCFYDFRFPPAMQKEFNGDDRFFPITYKETWTVVREIAGGLRHALQQGRLRRGSQARGRGTRQEAAAAAASAQAVSPAMDACRS